MIAQNLFKKGYTQLVSVIPPNAPLSPSSRISPDQRGKTPGLRGANGTWYGYGWLKHAATLEDTEAWDEAKANVGLIGERFPALDIDCTDPQLVEFVKRTAREVMGPAPVRIGRPPRALLVYRTAVPFGRQAIKVTHEGREHIVEFLGEGKQYVVHGQHPSGRDYSWERAALWQIPPEKLSEIDIERVSAFFRALEQRLTKAGCEVELQGIGKAKGAPVQQDMLLAPSAEALYEVVEAIDNDERFPDRDSYIQMGCAIKAAAGPEEEDVGLSVFIEWASRWPGDEKNPEGNDSETVAQDWRRMYPPFRLGWSWLVEQAGEVINAAVYEFEADPELEIGPAPEAPNHEQAHTTQHTDRWVAEQVVEDLCGLLRFVPETGHWHVWNRGRWERDRRLLHDFYVSESLRRLGVEMEARTAQLGEKEAKPILTLAVKVQNRNATENTIKIIRAHPMLSVAQETFDADPWVLNTPGGQVDLREGKLYPADPDAMCSKSTAVTPKKGDAPMWFKFLRETTGNDRALIRYLQVLCGYALSGSTQEQTFSFVWGPGGNGKSVFLDTVAGAMGDYAVTAPMDTFASMTGDRHPTDIAGLVGARLVTAEETQAGRRWDEAKLKSITGGSSMSARFMRQDFFEFTPTFKLILVGNHQPEIGVLDDAMRRRIHVVPFVRKPKEVDRLLSDKLQQEWPQILLWMIEGCAIWLRDGLVAPEAVLTQTADYFEEEDKLGAWLEATCEITADEEDWVSANDLFRSWQQFCNARGERAGSQNLLSRQIKMREGIWKAHGGHPRRTRGFAGVKILTLEFGEES